MQRKPYICCGCSTCMKAYLELIRPSNTIMAGFAVFLSGAIAAGRQIPPLDVFLAVLGTICASSGGMVTNDYFDYEIDLINRPERALPRGALTRKRALIFACVLFVLALLFIAFTNWLCIAIGYPAVFLIVVYSWKLKRRPFIGNFAVAFLTSLTLVYGGAAAGNIVLVTMLAICAFFANLSREIVKDIEDMKGTDFGLIIGGGIDFGLDAASKRKIMVDLRYILGLTTIHKSVEGEEIVDVKNGVFSLMVGFSF